ncbi:MAG TPA: DUF5522 domain-containing protein [Chitinophagaceae bacterium]|nr:DUF5522 domain-containing protein [Chitinophagaceae bacterium]
MNDLVKGIHFYINEKGYVVFTSQYLRERGFCCGNGCLHCPYQYENVKEPLRSELLEKRIKDLGSGS